MTELAADEARSRFVDIARSYIGVPWRHMGRTRNGIDCIGLVVLTAKDCGIEMELEQSYGRMEDYTRVIRELSKFGTRVGKPEVGDVLIYKHKRQLHMAICTQLRDGKVYRVIHAYRDGHTVCETTLGFEISSTWRFNAWL